jgi:hypothetical protein
MSKLETELVEYKGHEYVCAWIPEIVTPIKNTNPEVCIRRDNGVLRCKDMKKN